MPLNRSRIGYGASEYAEATIGHPVFEEDSDFWAFWFHHHGWPQHEENYE